MKDQAAAVQWARALFEETKAASAVGGVHKDLGEVLQSWRSGDELWSVLENPMVPAPKARELLETAYEKKLNPITLRFVGLLAAKRRLPFLPLIAQHFERLADADMGIVRASIKSAYPLTEEQRVSLEKSLAKFCQKRQQGSKFQKVILESREDSNLIGGLTVKIGDWVLDHSLRSELQTLKETLSA